MAKDFISAKSLKNSFRWTVAGLVLLVVIAVLVFPTTRGLTDHGASPVIQNTRAIALMMFQYAVDNNGVYPSGKSSTEVYQQLIDANSCSDPTIFWDGSMKISVKIKPTSKKLKPENVCYDVTVPVDEKSSDDLPVVFLTGYKINYAPGGNAVPLFKLSDGRQLGIAAAYHDNTARFKLNNLPNGTATNFISPDFDPAGKKYQQLTPDGVLSP